MKYHSLKPSVSVIMAVYNGEKFLRQAVQSILNQNFKDFEFIIINDGSTDRTLEILKSFKDSRIRIFNRENKGLANSLNEGIFLSKGKYIARMDSDDESLKNRLKLQYEYMESNPDIDILGGQAWKINEYNQIIGVMNKPRSFNDIARYIKCACPVIHPTYFVRKHVYKRVGGYRDFAPTQDYDFILRAFEFAYKINNLPDRILNYRVNASSLSYKNSKSTIIFRAKIQKMHLNRIKGKNNEERDLLFLKKYKKKPGTYFQMCYDIWSFFLQLARSKKGVLKYIILFIVILSSMLHHQILFYNYKSFKSLLWNR